MEFVDGAGNRAAQDDEMEALQSIYGEDCILHKAEHSCEVYVHPSDENWLSGSSLRICVHFPESYPSTSEPVVEMEAPWLHDETRQKLSEALHRVYLENVGEVIIFTWVEWLKEQVWLWEEVRKWTNRGGGPRASKGKDELKDSFTNRGGIGDALNGGWMSSSSEFEQVLQDHDDDGETAAGGRLLHLLQIVDAINVVVVVSRWFGGILLGPDRFKHINNCARSLLDICGYIEGSGQAGSHTDKKKSQSKGASQKGRR